MAITARDIHEVEFSHAMRGYKEAEVDDFLDLCAAEVDRLSRENDLLMVELDEARRVPVAPIPAAVAPMPTRVEVEEVMTVSRVSSTELGDILLLAQSTAEDLIMKANSQADRIVSAAEGRASEIVGEAATRKLEIIASAKLLKEAEVSFRGQFRALLEDSINNIREIPLDIPADDADDTIGSWDTPVPSYSPIETVVEEPFVSRTIEEPVVSRVIEEPTVVESVVEPVEVEASVERVAPIDPGILESTSFIGQVQFDDDFDIAEID